MVKLYKVTKIDTNKIEGYFIIPQNDLKELVCTYASDGLEDLLSLDLLGIELKLKYLQKNEDTFEELKITEVADLKSWEE